MCNKEETLIKTAALMQMNFLRRGNNYKLCLSPLSKELTSKAEENGAAVSVLFA